MPANKKRKIVMAVHLFVQACLFFIMLFCFFGFLASVEFLSFTRFQIAYFSIFVLCAILFILLSTNKIHRLTSYIIVSLASLCWIYILLGI
ncbi:MAG: hypothetical protein BGO43_03240 [Gammaproteobacteria bacterium 39-13]|nr:MAG: hypothetical protein BGO43_03240 [Gammaproteobacteria bacterium 39-13]